MQVMRAYQLLLLLLPLLTPRMRQYPEEPNLLTGYLAMYPVDTNLEGELGQVIQYDIT